MPMTTNDAQTMPMMTKHAQTMPMMTNDGEQQKIGMPTTNHKMTTNDNMV
jgi:hypothetical protein